MLESKFLRYRKDFIIGKLQWLRSLDDRRSRFTISPFFHTFRFSFFTILVVFYFFQRLPSPVIISHDYLFFRRRKAKIAGKTILN